MHDDERSPNATARLQFAASWGVSKRERPRLPIQYPVVNRLAQGLGRGHVNTPVTFEGSELRKQTLSLPSAHTPEVASSLSTASVVASVVASVFSVRRIVQSPEA